MKEQIPANILDAVWQVIESALTPELIGAVIITLAATHLTKIVAEAWLDTVTESAKRWRAFCAITSVLIGFLAGTIAWMLTGASWYVVPAVAFGSGPVWRLAQALAPPRLTRPFLTATDCKYRRRHEPECK